MKKGNDTGNRFALLAGLLVIGESHGAVMSFGDVQAFSVSPYLEEGFLLTASTPAHGILDPDDSNFSSHYFAFNAAITTATIVLDGGGSFELRSLEVALGELAVGSSTDITFVGTLSAGGTLSTTVTNVTTLQNVVLNWTGLESVTISGTDDPGLDNIVLIPEPSSLLFLGLGTIGLFSFRRRNNLS